MSDGSENRDRFATRAVHAGLTPDPSFGSVIPAIHQTSTYAQRAPGHFVDDYDYARSANPTRAALEQALAELEGGQAVAFSSGLAAEHALITVVCEAGAHIVLPDDLYGGTYRLVDKVLSRWGLAYDLVGQTDLEAVAGAVRDDPTRGVLCGRPFGARTPRSRRQVPYGLGRPESRRLEIPVLCAMRQKSMPETASSLLYISSHDMLFYAR